MLFALFEEPLNLILFIFFNFYLFATDVGFLRDLAVQLQCAKAVAQRSTVEHSQDQISQGDHIAVRLTEEWRVIFLQKMKRCLLLEVVSCVGTFNGLAKMDFLNSKCF